MNRSTIFSTQNLDVAAAIETVTKQNCLIEFGSGGPAVFCFKRTPEVLQVVIEFESGLACNARNLLATRSSLFKRLKGGR
ncbi:hypothetical protein [Trichlorobacter lovleyi]|jgi:hypothetical protein|uniref:Uncharacterized protein n=1 Tax=Trichlorobacter lovleyi (strain ATCC BAA-1151 / DSM 17278 / SZ) TaxID=398767 RepID=B3E9U9_TRIL1|nr:hypothetical protein [Trichlorobacter lovleyi]ACD96824.1 conserved hypothetical protein [Trichlorobacter lovleyi SZ]